MRLQADERAVCKLIICAGERDILCGGVGEHAICVVGCVERRSVKEAG